MGGDRCGLEHAPRVADGAIPTTSTGSLGRRRVHARILARSRSVYPRDRLSRGQARRGQPRAPVPCSLTGSTGTPSASRCGRSVRHGHPDPAFLGAAGGTSVLRSARLLVRVGGPRQA
jgi:hypothetical protein